MAKAGRSKVQSLLGLQSDFKAGWTTEILVYIIYIFGYILYIWINYSQLLGTSPMYMCSCVCEAQKLKITILPQLYSTLLFKTGSVI